MKTKQSKIISKSSSNYLKYEAGSTRVLIPPEPRALLEKLRKMSGATNQMLIDVAISQLYERAVVEGKISFTVKIDINNK